MDLVSPAAVTRFKTGDSQLDLALEHLAPAVERACLDADSAHDFAHVLRVTQLAQRLTLAEHGDPWVSVTAAWLHELFNYPKGHPDSKLSGTVCAEHAEKLLSAHHWNAATIARVRTAIAEHPFSLGITPQTLEGKLLQDADRLDAIGAIGIARCFATSAAMKRPFYHTMDPFAERRALDDKTYGLDHFAAKLFKLAGSMHTESARVLAAKRDQFMRAYLQQLGAEIVPSTD
jgi:uncharacterized protein